MFGFLHSLGRYRFWSWFLWLILALALNSAANSDHGESTPALERYSRLQLSVPVRQVDSSRWYISFDNDFFAPKNRDQDYTYGLNFAYASNRVADWFPARFLQSIDSAFALGDQKATRGRVLEFGLYGFTPSNVDSRQVGLDDRPYSSLVYASVTGERLNWSEQSVVRTQLTFGVLGLDWVGDLQNMTHRFSDSQQAMGWEHQISAGGEPTFRYSIARAKLLNTGFEAVEARHTISASIGYITEVSWSLGLRTGKIHTPWHSFQPEVKNYAESLASKRSNVPERYFWIGAATKVRGYNAFLQGQFRDSERTYNSDELRLIVFEMWLGYTHEFANGYYINYALRSHTSEIKDGVGDRNMIWGGILIGRNII